MYKKFHASLAFITAIFILQTSVVAQKNKTMSENINNSDSLKGITIHQEISFKASPQRLYETLLNSKKFSDCTKMSFADFTAMSANIDFRVNPR
jgi:hypothetical protein